MIPQKSLRGKQRLGGLKILNEVETARNTVSMLKEKGDFHYGLV